MRFKRGEIVTVQRKTIGIHDPPSPKRERIISPGTMGTVQAVSTRKLNGIPEKFVLVDFPSLIDERWVRPEDLQHGNPGVCLALCSGRQEDKLQDTGLSKGLKKEYTSLLGSEYVALDESRRLGIPNPKRRTHRHSAKSFLPLVVIGGLSI